MGIIKNSRLCLQKTFILFLRDVNRVCKIHELLPPRVWSGKVVTFVAAMFLDLEAHILTYQESRHY